MKLQRLSRPEVLENIIAATPGLAEDPIAVSIIQDPELLSQLCDANTVRRVVEAHPSLAEAANSIVVVLHEEAATASTTNPSTSSGYSYSLDALSDDEEMDSSQVNLNTTNFHPIYCRECKMSGFMLFAYESYCCSSRS